MIGFPSAGRLVRRLPSVATAVVLVMSGCHQPRLANADAEGSTARGETLSVLPAPQRVTLAGGTLALGDTLACSVADASLRPLIPVLDGELRLLAARRVVESAAIGARCRFALDPALREEEYRLAIDSGIRLTGGSYDAVAMGTVTLLQMLDRGGVPRGVIADRPGVPFRALLVDLGRRWHEVSVLEQVIELARWYKIGYVQLHLTDDPLFTFPTRAFPELPTPGRHYSVAELRALDEFARYRGVTLIPELEMPGHASLMVARRPDIFGFAGVTEWRGTINIGREAAYAALDTMIGELADVFRTSPYIHIGGDEASLTELSADADVRAYLATHGLADVDELYRHFLVRVDSMVKRRGKQMIVWEGFHRDGRPQIPRDVLVMAWESIYQLPQDLLAGGYTIMNVSWKPLYVVNQKKWPVEYIYDVWNLYRWENWVPKMPSFTPIQLDSTARVIGAMMCSWEQPQHVELSSLRRRLAAMSERTWNGSVRPERPYAWFEPILARTDAKLQAVLTPVVAEARGLRFPGLDDGPYGEQGWFDDTVRVTLRAGDGLMVRYTLDGSMPVASSPIAPGPITLAATTHLRARAFARGGEPVGYDRWLAYQLRPLRADVRGRLGAPVDTLWEPAARFTGPVTIRLSSARPGTIRYTLDGSAPTATSTAYRAPLTVSSATAVRARLFDNAGVAVGEEWAQRFEPSG